LYLTVASLFMSILMIRSSAYEDGTDSEFRNVGK